MRAKRTAQISLFDPQALDHPVADELEWASAWLGAHPELLDRIAADLDGGAGSSLGRHGLTRETVLRCAVLMHLRGESYRGLAFALVDSLSAQRFARLDPARRPPGKSVLQGAVGAVGAANWEAINRTLLEMARASGVETGDRVRIDSTVTETHILEPSDSRLLFDGHCQSNWTKPQELAIEDSQAASWRHSVRAAARCCLKMSRRLRWRSWLKWLWIEAWTAVNFCRVLMSLNRAIAPSRLRKRLMRVLGSIVKPAPAFLPSRVSQRLHRRRIRSKPIGHDR